MSDCAYAIKSGTNVILNYIAEEIYDDCCYDDADLLAAFIAIRKELASGNLRALYLGWLLSVQNREVPDDEPEPAAVAADVATEDWGWHVAFAMSRGSVSDPCRH